MIEVRKNFKNIILIGMRGSGKSTAGKLLANKLGYGFMDTDAMVEERAGMQIADIVRRFGWEIFRQKEGEVIAEAVMGGKMVIATGGGVVEREENMEKLKANGYMIFLDVPQEILVSRIEHDKATRPLLTDAETLEEDLARVWKEREPLYRIAADAIINSATQDPESTTEEIITYLKEGNVI